MRNLFLSLLALSALLAACTAVGTEPAAQNNQGSETGPALQPVESGAESALDNYPPPADMDSGMAYPAAPVAGELPAGYPDLTVVAPSGSVDLGQLTAVPGDPTPRVAPAPGRPTLPPGAVQSGLMLEATVANLSDFAGITTDAIQVVSVEPTTWPDAGLGCPVEGMAYAQVLVEGSIITLRAGDEAYTYHTAGSEYVLCRDGERLAEGIVPRGG